MNTTTDEQEDFCRCIFKPRDLGQYSRLHCTACDQLYRGSVYLCAIHAKAPELVEALRLSMTALNSVTRDALRWGYDIDWDACERADITACSLLTEIDR